MLMCHNTGCNMHPLPALGGWLARQGRAALGHRATCTWRPAHSPAHLLPQPPVNLLAQLGPKEAGRHLQLLLKFHQVEHHGGVVALWPGLSTACPPLPCPPLLSPRQAGGPQGSPPRLLRTCTAHCRGVVHGTELQMLEAAA